MNQSWSSWHWNLELVIFLVVSGAITFFGDCTFAQIKPDATLGSESSVIESDVVVNGLLSEQVNSGARRGVNLFHSFREFNIDEAQGVYFTNPAGIENIVTRVTGDSPSHIRGKLGVLGSANLFLLNPNGIIFGPHASLDVGGSFLASTAGSLKFADNTQFNATASQTAPLLTVSVPVGLQYSRPAAEIYVQGTTLEMQSGKTLALVGGDVTLAGSYLKAPEGRIELGSVTGSSLISLNSTDKGWNLRYGNVQNFGDIRLSQQALVDTTSEGSGDIQVQGRQVILTDGSQILTVPRGSKPGGSLTINASEVVEVTGTSPPPYPINSGLIGASAADGTAGNIIINTKRLLVQAGAAISAESAGVGNFGQFMPATGRGGNLTVIASESVELADSLLLTQTQGSGDAGDLTINTGRLLVRDRAKISSSTRDEGRGGSLTVNASDSIKLIGSGSGLFASTEGTGAAGYLTIATGKLIVQDGAQVTVSSQGRSSGSAGRLEVSARSIQLDNGGALTATTDSGNGGDMTLQAHDLLLIRHNSQISTTAGIAGDSRNGGTISIDTGILVGVENSDISANAFEGKGGTIDITAQGIFGLVKLELEDLKTRLGTTDLNELQPSRLPSSDITAISQTNPSLRGQVTINRPEVDPSQGVVALPAEVVDASGLIAQGCPAGGGQVASQFIVTGRGGLPDNPSQTLSSDTVWGDLRSSTRTAENQPSFAVATQPTNSTTEQLVEARGWVINNKGEVVLTAATPSVTPHIPWMTPSACHAP